MLPTAIITDTTIILVFILFGGLASGPARRASIISENIRVATVQRDHIIPEQIDSETGYETSKFKVSSCIKI